ncbi:hydroxyethylthiazole kinase [Pseudovibrio exalbescens]|uniref:hydroxyethylthiazole kinase n=1 Tax=Pseudovibrio exalbescens TaxID=197461 RepID=UPI002366C585|nr:hydroxyethylthiazole kinase [Pseudovibrio exalbescens]MDD7909755.1 hydroxyethylthiazole kinase [Pseudovibrio exalbescens]
MNLIESACETLTKIRQTSPLVHNMTNIVVANTTANALLAIGASPAMVDGPEEAPELASVAGALVVNVGTVTPAQAEAMKLACAAAQKAGRPWVLDPVAVGALTFRTNLAKELLAFKPTVIRGNASEIMALAGEGSGGKGVDSTDSSEAALVAAKTLARTSGAVVAVSGPTDYITDGERTLTVKNGHELMPFVTGLGCTATALTGAAVAVAEDKLEAAAHALLFLGLAGETAAQDTAGPASLQVDIINQLYHLTPEQVKEAGKLDSL